MVGAITNYCWWEKCRPEYLTVTGSGCLAPAGTIAPIGSVIVTSESRGCLPLKLDVCRAGETCL